MNFNIRPYWSQFLLLLALMALGMSIKQCRNNADMVEESKNYLSSLNDTITHLKSGVAQKPAVVVDPSLFEQVAMENESLKLALKRANIMSKNVKSFTQEATVTRIGNRGDSTISIAIHDTIPCPGFMPIPFHVDSQYYSIAGRIEEKKLVFLKINFPDSVFVITANKTHFLRKNELIISIGHSNPMIKTIGIQNFIVSEKSKWWESGWAKMGAGLIGGIYISQKLLK